METRKVNSKTRRPGFRTGIVFGVILIILGSLLAASNFNVVPSNLKDVILSWQMLFVVIGILALFRRHLFMGLCLILAGCFFAIPKLTSVFPDAFSWAGNDFVSDYWSILLIVAGILLIIYLLLKPNRKSYRQSHGNCSFNCSDGNKTQNQINNDFSKTVIFSGGEYIVLEPEFKGGRIEIIFGGGSLDLRKTSLPEGDTYLDVNIIFGGIKIFTPSEWTIVIQADGIFGGFQDDRGVPTQKDTTRKLIITGACIFGGVEING
jgi:predicted membrane protein